MRKYIEKYIIHISLIITFLVVIFNFDVFIQLYYKIKFQYAVSFDSNFESGSLKGVKLVSVNKVKINKNEDWLLSYEIEPNADPSKATDTIIPSTRWFYFRIVGVKGKIIQLNFKETDPAHPVYSYDNLSFNHFNENESAFRIVQKKFEKDTVYISYSVPYNLSRLNDKIELWKQKTDLLKVDTIGLSNLSIPIIALSIVDNTNKYNVYVHSRVHPSETPSSWLIEGMIDALLTGSSLSNKFINNINFYFVPVVNPDGVSNGLSRTNINGVDLESNFCSLNNLQKESASIIEFYNSIDNKLDLILNLHSQVAPYTTFWLHDSLSTSSEYYKKELELERIFAKNNSLYNISSRFTKSLPNTTIEKLSWDNSLGETLALTLETPYTYFKTNNRGKVWLTMDNIGLSGELLLKSICEYLGVDSYLAEQQTLETIPANVRKLINAYPNSILGYKNDSLILTNNTKLIYDDRVDKMHYELLFNPNIEDMFKFDYDKNLQSDAGRYRSEELFKHIYGKNRIEVENSLVEVVWCPSFINKKIKVTSINNTHKAFERVSMELDNYPQWKEYLIPAGTYNWRYIAGSNRLSSHSYGIAIDINAKYSNYWRWDFPTATEYCDIPYKNNIPLDIVKIFEKHGFIWGGRWKHYDTMHFEYRPELIMD